MKSYLSHKTEKRKSKIDNSGWGLFAKEGIKKDEIVGIKAGHIIERQEFDKRGGVSSKTGEATLQIADDFFLGPLNSKEIEDIMMSVNHSCSPNIGFMGNIIVVAMRDIKKGEELATDYVMHINYPKFNMKCLCNQKGCRKVITGQDWQNKKLQKKYGKYFSSYLRNKF